MNKIPELKINKYSVYDTFGVRMGDGFLDALTEPLTLKENIENESRLEHGKRIIVDANPKIASRELLLDFTLPVVPKKTFCKRKIVFLLLCIRVKSRCKYLKKARMCII